jgi:predicted flap endonuclease-1-like 5' DNA nuclease
MTKGMSDPSRMILQSVGIHTYENLLKACLDQTCRDTLAKSTGFSPSEILELAACADLVRIKGIGWEYARLLYATGIHSVPDLAKLNPQKLFADIVEVNFEKNIAKRLPSSMHVDSWIRQAFFLPPVLQLD